jgi:hypothetical protein
VTEALGLREAEEAGKRGRWTLRLLECAASKLLERIDRRVNDWGHTYFLHVEGSYKTRLEAERVRTRARYVGELLETAKKSHQENHVSAELVLPMTLYVVTSGFSGPDGCLSLLAPQRYRSLNDP